MVHWYHVLDIIAHAMVILHVLECLWRDTRDKRLSRTGVRTVCG